MSSISLKGSIRGCRIDSGWANRIQSDRFENSNLMVCPPWGGVDNLGREVSRDSWNTKTAGCSNPEDRIGVENYQRPQYSEYITLDTSALSGNMYRDNGVLKQRDSVNQIKTITGNPGVGYNAYITSECNPYKYDVQQQMIANNTQKRVNDMAYSYSESRYKNY